MGGDCSLSSLFQFGELLAAFKILSIIEITIEIMFEFCALKG
jgi:hypothetical protein